MNIVKRIFFISVSHPKFGIGGAEIQTYEYAREFQANGWESYFLSKRTKNVNSFSSTDDRIHELFYNKTNNLNEILKILWLIIKLRPHAIFYRFHKFHFGLIVFISKLTGSKTIWSPMSDEYCDLHAATKALRARHFNNSIYAYAKLTVYDKIFSYGVKKASIIFSQNKIQSEIIKKNFGRESSTLYSSVKIDPYPLEKRENVCLFIASIKEMKNPEIFCEIAAWIKKTSENIKFEIIGKNYSNPEFADNLVQLINKTGVVYNGELTLEVIQSKLKRSKLLINTSTFEGFPNTFIRAWANGVPVVSLNVDPDNLIESKKIGVFCRGSVERMEEAIKSLMAKEEEWNILSINAYNFAKEKVNIINNTKKIIELIRSV